VCHKLYYTTCSVILLQIGKLYVGNTFKVKNNFTCYVCGQVAWCHPEIKFHLLVTEYKVLKKMLGQKTGEMTERYRNVHNNELNYMH
jgi:hypothetical protein